MPNSYVYKILNRINNKFYIGSTNNFKTRKRNHIYKLKNNKHDNIYLQRAWNKYGEENFEFIIMKKIPREKQFEEEQKYLDKLQPFGDNGYNIVADINNPFNCGKIEKICVFCNEKFETHYHSQKYCDRCRNYQDNYYMQLEKEGVVKFIGGKYKFV